MKLSHIQLLGMTRVLVSHCAVYSTHCSFI